MNNTAILSIVFFFVAIILAFVRKNNIGVLAMAIGAVAVRCFGLTDKDLYGGVSVSLFTTLAGITLLFSIITKTGALDLLARKIVALAGRRIWLLPILIALTGFVIVASGAGGVPALAIVPPLAVSIALEVGYNPVMMACIGITGQLSGRFCPLTPEGQIIINAVTEGGYPVFANPAIMIITFLTSVVMCLVLFFAFGGHKVKAPEHVEKKQIEKFSGKQIVALCSIVAMLLLIVVVGVNIGIAALCVAAVLLLFRVADDGECIKAMPWNTIMMVLFVGALLGIVNKVGGIDMMTNALASVMNSATATPLMGLSAGLLSLVSSALSVVYPTMMPICIGLGEQIEGAHTVALMAAVGAGGAMAGTSPMSTGGALIMAALGNNMSPEEYTKEYQNKVFVQLLLVSAGGLIVLMLCAAIFYVPLANLLCPAG